MKNRIPSLLWGAVVLSLCLAWGVEKYSRRTFEPSWSTTTNGLRARIELRPKDRYSGTLRYSTFLVLENVSDTSSPIEVDINFGTMELELLDAQGVLQEESFVPHSGPLTNPGMIQVHVGSTIELDLTSGGWGIGANGPPRIAALDSLWEIPNQLQGGFYIRGTITNESTFGSKRWSGKIVTPMTAVPPDK